MKTHAFLRRTLLTTLLCGLALSQGQVKAANQAPAQAQSYRNSAEYMETVEKVFKPAIVAVNNIGSLNDLTNLTLPQPDASHKAVVSERNLNILSADLICAQHMPTLVDKVATACDRIHNAFEGQDQPLSNNEKLAVASFKTKLIRFAKYFMVFDDEVKGSISAVLTQQTQSHKCYKEAVRCCELFEQIMAIVDSFETDITVSSNTKAALAAKAPAQEADVEEKVVEEEKEEEKEIEEQAPIQPILPQDNKQSVGNAANPTTNGGLSVGQAGALAVMGGLSALVPAVISSVLSSTPETKTEAKTSHVEAPKDAVDLTKQAEEQKHADELKQAAALAAQQERLAQVERARVAAEQARLDQVEHDRVERERLAQVEQARVAAEQARLAQVEHDRIERERLAQVEQARVAAEQARLAQVEHDRVERERLAQVEQARVAAEQKQAKDATEAPKQATVAAQAPQFTKAQETHAHIVRTLPGLPALSVVTTSGKTPSSNAVNLHASSSSAISGSASSTTTTKQEAPIVPADDQKAILALEKEAHALYADTITEYARINDRSFAEQLEDIELDTQNTQSPATQLLNKLISIAQIYGKHAFTNKRAAKWLGVTEMAIDHVCMKFNTELTTTQKTTLKAIYPADNRWFGREAVLPTPVAKITDPEHLFEIWSCNHIVPTVAQTNLIQTRINALDKTAGKTKTPEQAEKVALETFPADFATYSTFARQRILNKLMIQAQNVIATQDTIHEIATRNLLSRALEFGTIGEYTLIFKKQLDLLRDEHTGTDEITHADTALSSVSMMSSSSATAS